MELTVKECLSYGWRTFLARPWFFAGTVLLIMVIQGLSSALQKGSPGLVAFIISIIVSTLLYSGLINLYVKAHDDVRGARFSDLWNPKPFWRYLAVSVLVSAIVFVGFILLIVPGIIAGLAVSLSGYLVVDKSRMPIKALKESLALTRGKRWKLLLIDLSFAGIIILGFIPLLLGTFIAVPVVMLAAAHAYRILAGAKTPLETPQAPTAA